MTRDDIDYLESKNTELERENERLTDCLRKLSDYYELHGSWDKFQEITDSCGVYPYAENRGRK